MKQNTLFSALLSGSLLFSPLINAHELSKDGALEAYNWTGFYAGANLGAVKHVMNITDTQATTFNATIEQVLNPKFVGGFQLGYRRQFVPAPASGILGLELSAIFTGASSNKVYGSPFALYQLRSHNKLKNIPLLQFIGGIAADRTYFFLAAGLAWTNISGSMTNTDGIPFFNGFSLGKKQLGTALGCGIEYAFNDKFSARFKVDAISSDAYSVLDNTGSSYQISNKIVLGTFGVNYRFG